MHLTLALTMSLYCIAQQRVELATLRKGLLGAIRAIMYTTAMLWKLCFINKQTASTPFNLEVYHAFPEQEAGSWRLTTTTLRGWRLTTTLRGRARSYYRIMPDAQETLAQLFMRRNSFCGEILAQVNY